MAEKFRALGAAGSVLMVMAIAPPALAQKQGGILRQYMISVVSNQRHQPPRSRQGGD
jgi:hypothetical protein